MSGDVASAAGQHGRQPWWQVTLELALVVALTATSLRQYVPLSATPFLLLLGWLSLRRRGLGWRDVGFARPASWPRALALGLLAGLAMELFATFVSVPFLSHLLGRPPELSEFRPLVGNAKLLALAVTVSWILAAFGEELAHRGYVLNRLAGLLGGGRSAWALALLATTALFGAAHEAQDLTGMLQEGFAGLLLGLLYLGSRRNLAVPIVAHGVSNTLAFVLIYLDRYPGV